MKIIVTGAAGFIGSRFCEMAFEAGHEVIGIDALTYSGRSKNLAAIDQLVFYHLDICNAGLLRDILQYKQPDAIVHLAAETHVTRSIDSREAFLRTNVIGTNVLLEVALEYWKQRHSKERGLTYSQHFALPPFRFLHVSTDEVYGSLGANDAPWTEHSPYAPKNPYSASKAASDHLAMAFHNTYGLPVIVTHAANNYGPRQHPEKLIPTLIRQCMHGEPMTLHGDGQQKRDWLYVDDHCRGLLAALERGKVGDTYNFGGECERTNEQVARLVWKASWPSLRPMWGDNLRQYPPETMNMLKFIADRPGNDRRYLMDVESTYERLGWVPEVDIEDKIAETVQWYLAHPDYGDEYGK